MAFGFVCRVQSCGQPHGPVVHATREAAFKAGERHLHARHTLGERDGAGVDVL